ncbi:MAG: hypothetical protein Q7J86_02170 [Bacteroidota bacterium]|nr:hypothetical protein [Bacteroidota bacterium]MDO9613313.1 hypothetical protein [Bacteroidota bacterium]
MKKLIALCLVVLLTFSAKSQEKTPPQYLLFEFMRVKADQGSNYWQVEEFWSGIHKQRVADKSITGWDLWSLTPSGTEQGSQFLTVTIFTSLKDMLQAIGSLDVMAYAKKAYPKMTDKEFTAMYDKTGKSRDMAHQVLIKVVDGTKGDFTMKVGTMITMDIMKQLDDSYEKVESEIFKPWHQQMVDDGKKGSWQLLQAILPAGSESYGTHITVSMYNDVAQLATFMEGSGGDMDLTTQLAVKEGLKTRDWKEVKIGKLEMMVR